VHGVKTVASYNGEQMNLTIIQLTRGSIIRKVQCGGEVNQSDLTNLQRGYVMMTRVKEIIILILTELWSFMEGSQSFRY